MVRKYIKSVFQISVVSVFFGFAYAFLLFFTPSTLLPTATGTGSVITSTGSALGSSGPVEGTADIIGPGDKNPCKLTAVGLDTINTLTCTKAGASVQTAGGLAFFTPCELFLRATSYGSSNGTPSPAAFGAGQWKQLLCTEFVSPMPASMFSTDAGTGSICINVNVDRGTGGVVGTPSKIVLTAGTLEQMKTSNLLCNAIAQKSGGGFEGLLSFLVFLFGIAQPILITAGILSIAFYGLRIMFTSAGPEESIKQMIKHGESILLGFVLLFCIKVILITINGIFFVK